MLAKTANKIEFGDFQTPVSLTEEICRFISKQGISPYTVIEPTCGKGNFIYSSLNYFKQVKRIIGLECNNEYVNQLKDSIKQEQHQCDIDIIHGNFFDFNWNSIFADSIEPVLVIGNPPWVTNSSLESLNSGNLPVKSNFLGYSGLEALTGKSNFDISEWILIKLIHQLTHKNAVLAFLCKTATARKVLEYSWKNNINTASSDIHLINAKQHFNVSVDACLLVIHFSMTAIQSECRIFNDLSKNHYDRVIGYKNNQLISNIDLYHQTKKYYGPMKHTWRSGIKHDCSAVMELTKGKNGYINGLGETVHLEERYIYPLVKSSDVARDNYQWNNRYIIVTQSKIGEPTDSIKNTAPNLWNYLESHRDCFAKRKSSIYKNKPNYSIFGVGNYTFKPFKVAISGLYKKLQFVVLNPIMDKPVIPDDTVNFIGFDSLQEANQSCALLNSNSAIQFFQSYIFWDSKRPITVQLLNKLDLSKLAKDLKVDNPSCNRYLYPVNPQYSEGMLF